MRLIQLVATLSVIFAPLAAEAQQTPKHAFDVSELPAEMTYCFGTIGYDPRAAAAAEEEIEKFLTPAK